MTLKYLTNRYRYRYRYVMSFSDAKPHNETDSRGVGVRGMGWWKGVICQQATSLFTTNDGEGGRIKTGKFANRLESNLNGCYLYRLSWVVFFYYHLSIVWAEVVDVFNYRLRITWIPKFDNILEFIGFGILWWGVCGHSSNALHSREVQ